MRFRDHRNFCQAKAQETSNYVLYALLQIILKVYFEMLLQPYFIFSEELKIKHLFHPVK